MRNRELVLLPLLMILVAAPALAAGEEAVAITEAIEKAYVSGIWLKGDEQAARAGFDPAFVMQVARDEGLLSVSLDAWLERLGLSGKPLQEGIATEIEVLDQSGDAAVAKVEVLQNGEPLYTDYMSLYKRADGWKIVAKTFHAH